MSPAEAMDAMAEATAALTFLAFGLAGGGLSVILGAAVWWAATTAVKIGHWLLGVDGR
jgi:hypothetical protein